MRCTIRTATVNIKTGNENEKSEKFLSSYLPSSATSFNLSHTHTRTICIHTHIYIHIYIYIYIYTHTYIAFLNSIERLYKNFDYIIDPTDQLLTSLQRLWRMESPTSSEFDYLFKLLLIGDSGVGKSTLLLSFTSDTFEDLSPTIGVDFKVKYVTLGGKKLKLAIWDTAGQERFRTLTSSYYRGAQGIIMVYDVTRRETFTNLSDIWAKEIDLYSTNQDCIKMLVGNKVDKESERVVNKKEGIDFAREYGCLYIECSAKTRANVEQCFEELVLKILDTPSLLSDSTGAKRNIFKQKPPEPDTSTSGCC